MADIHFVASKDARERVVRMGEDPEMVFETGCPSIDLVLRAEGLPDFDPFATYEGLGGFFPRPGNYLVVVHHPVTTESESVTFQTEILLEVVAASGVPAFWFLPNADTGSEAVRKAVSGFTETHPLANIRFFRNMDSCHFLKLVKNAACVLGNSSVGIRECGYMGVPVINTGSRQQGRLRAGNVLDVGYNRENLMHALGVQLTHGPYGRSALYGTGGAGKRIADLLAGVPLRFDKQNRY